MSWEVLVFVLKPETAIGYVEIVCFGYLVVLFDFSPFNLKNIDATATFGSRVCFWTFFCWSISGKDYFCSLACIGVLNCALRL